MRDLYLSYAGFIYYLRQKGYTFHKQGKGFISVWTDNRTSYFFQVSDTKNDDCGYVYAHYDDLLSIFEDDFELLQTLLTKCVRANIRLTDRANLPHCSIGDSVFKSKISTNVDSEEIVNCKKT
jgi:hypothetical protein